MEKVTAYLSHAIRGAKREKATEEDIKANCQEALIIAKKIRTHVPQLDLWIPSEHEDFVHEAFRKGYLNENQILDVDCAIISKRDLLLVFIKNGLISNGMGIEITKAEELNIPIIRFHVEDDLQIKCSDLIRIQKIVNDIFERKNNESKNN